MGSVGRCEGACLLKEKLFTRMLMNPQTETMRNTNITPHTTNIRASVRFSSSPALMMYLKTCQMMMNTAMPTRNGTTVFNTLFIFSSKHGMSTISSDEVMVLTLLCPSAEDAVTSTAQAEVAAAVAPAETGRNKATRTTVRQMEAKCWCMYVYAFFIIVCSILLLTTPPAGGLLISLRFEQSIVNGHNEAPETKHNEKRDDAVDNDPPSFRDSLRIACTHDVFVDAPDDSDDRKADEKRDDCIRDITEPVGKAAEVEIFVRVGEYLDVIRKSTKRDEPQKSGKC